MPAGEGRERLAFQQGPLALHHRQRWSTSACAACGIKPFYGVRSATFPIRSPARPSSAMRFCKGWRRQIWSLHPTQVPIAKRVFSPDPAGGRVPPSASWTRPCQTCAPVRAVMIDGKMQDDATLEAEASAHRYRPPVVAAKDPDMGPQCISFRSIFRRMPLSRRRGWCSVFRPENATNAKCWRAA